MSISVIGLGLGSILVMSQKTFSWKQLKGFGLLLIVLYALHLLWILNSDNVPYAFNDFRRKLPLLVLPVAFMVHQPLIKKEFYKILHLFAAASIICSVILLLRWFGFGYKNADFRSFSDFISHIRFSVCLVISTLILLNHSLENKKYLLNAILFVPIAFSLIVMQSLSGFFLLATIIPLFLYWRQNIGKGLIISYFALIPIALTVGLVYHFKAKDPLPSALPTHTAKGQLYNHYPNNTLCENNHRVYLFLATEEMKLAWEERTGTLATTPLPFGYTYIDAMIRYLTSKNLPKDATGIAALTEKDIANIKKGYTNYQQGEFSAIEKRWHALRFELDSYQNGYDIAGHSITMRLEYFNVAWHCFKQNFWFGVGTGDVKDSIAAEHESRNILPTEYQKRAHNQLLTLLMTFGLIGFAVVLYIIIIYALGLTTLQPLGKAIIVLLFASLFWEDVLETQAGVTAFAFFYALLFSVPSKDNDTSRYTASIPSTIFIWLKSLAFWKAPSAKV